MMKWFALLLGLVALPTVAGAQNPQPAPPHETNPPVASPNSPQPPPEQIAPPARAPAVAADDKNLSDKLSRQQGTLEPPKAVDPGIHAPMPPRAGTSTMPVIPPPGSPGGDQKVVPK